VVPLRTKIADLEATAETSKVYQKKLEDQWVDREQKLGKMEVAFANKTDECAQLTTEKASLQAKVQELTSALASKDREMTAQAANFNVAEEKLVEESASSFAEGFAEALVQAACVNPGIDVTGCSPLNKVVYGKLVPLEAPEE